MASKKKEKRKKKSSKSTYIYPLSMAVIEKVVNLLIDLIPDALSEEDFKASQFLLDVICKNYKVPNTRYRNLILGMSYFAIPFEEIVKSFTGPFSFAFVIAKTPIDEYIASKIISNIINNELENYLEFIRQDKYEPSSTSEAFKVFKYTYSEVVQFVKDVVTKEQELNKDVVTTDIVDASIKRSQTLSEAVVYTEADYRSVIEEYIQTCKEEFVTIDYKKLKKKVIFNQFFDINVCQEIVQNKMSDILESSTSKMHTYKLKETRLLDRLYLKQNTDINVTSSLLVEKQMNNVIFYADNNSSALEAISRSICSTKQFLDENPDSITTVYQDYIIELDVKNDNNVTIISTNVEHSAILKDIEAEYANFFKVQAIKAVSSKLKEVNALSLTSNNDIAISENIDRKVESAIHKVQKLTEDEKVLSFKDFERFMSSSSKISRDEYLISCQKNANVKRVGTKDLTIIPVKRQNALKENSKKQMTLDNVLMTTKISGSLNDQHLTLIQDKLFDAQLLAKDTPYQDVKVIINCGDGVLINADITKKMPIKIIDLKSKISRTTKDALQKILETDAYMQGCMI